MNTAHNTEVKLWADILSESSDKSQKLEGIVRYTKICERSLNIAHEAGAQQGKERGTSSAQELKRILPFPFSFG